MMTKNHKADSFDGGRAASVISDAAPAGPPEESLRRLLEVKARSEDEEMRALALAIMALTTNND
ncbi:MAG TPA: hypothetical protein VIG38_12685 [Hyphomicrobium sp.]|jgi:hypothetical protein